MPRRLIVEYEQQQRSKALLDGMHLTPVQFETRVALVVIEFFLVKNDTDLGRNDVLPTLKGIFIINFQIMLVTKTKG